MSTDTTARERLARLLAADDTMRTRADSAELWLSSDTLMLEVEGHGRVLLPVRAAEAKRLIVHARPADFGHGTETISDTSVRDTWQISPDQVSLGGPLWQASLDAVLERFDAALGLPTGSRLRAELHSMLIYGKGQFFLPHQDSEKRDDMIATMVIVLPSAHTGGELIVDDGGHPATYRGSRDDLTLVAFYADRRHEVRPVRSGYRVTLTFNLMLSRGADRAPGQVSTEVARCLTEHFTTPAVSSYSGQDLGTPDRLVVLLDHQYSQRGLASEQFKGADTDRVAALRAAADLAECDLALALAEIRETWNAVPDHSYDPWSGGEEYWDDDVSDEGTYDQTDLIDDELSLSWWTAPADPDGETIALRVDGQETCAPTATRDLEPYQTEFEGYMGNYGNTVDRWYRRAAVVIWPRSRTFLVRAEASPGWALAALGKQLDAGDFDAARADAASLEPLWRSVPADLLPTAMEVASVLDDPALSHMLLRAFTVEALTETDAAALVDLTSRYGRGWTHSLLTTWERPAYHRSGDPGAWLATMVVPLTTAIRGWGDDALADLLVRQLWESLMAQVRGSLAHPREETRRGALGDLAAATAALLGAASADAGVRCAQELISLPSGVVDLALPVLRERSDLTTPALSVLNTAAQKTLTSLLNEPERQPDDWSIIWSGCGCDLCERLRTFLGSTGERSWDWPLATPGRRHIHAQIETSGLPVRHVTRRQGRPYTLVLQKTDELFTRERNIRRRRAADLAWLTPGADA